MRPQKILLTFFLTLFAPALALVARAQDKIYKVDGAIIDAKVKTVTDKTVIYTRFDNPDGPQYTILTTTIAKIVYQNGTIDIFDGFTKAASHKKSTRSPRSPGEKNKPSRYGDNIFSVTPVAYTAAPDGSINDVGIGISYERLLDRRGRLGLNLPLMLFFSSSSDYNNSATYYASPVTSDHYNSVYFMPGIKFYPAPDRYRVRYSLGFSFFCILGGEPASVYNDNYVTVYNPTTGTYSYPATTGTYHYAMYGFMISNSVNITATQHLYMALDLGAGIPVSDNRYAQNQNLGIPVPFVQFGFKVGCKY